MPRWTPDGLKPTFKKDLSGLSSYSFNSSDGLDSNAFSSYIIEVTDVVPSVALDFWARISGNTGTNYASLVEYRKSNASGGNFDSPNNTKVDLSVSGIDESGLGASGYIFVHLGSSAGNPRMFSELNYEDNSDFFTWVNTKAQLLVTGLATSIDFLLSGAGTFTRGTLSFHGIRRIS